MLRVKERVDAYVKRYIWQSCTPEDFEDFCSIGLLAALQAHVTFDPTRGTQLESYMVWRGCCAIMTAMKRYQFYKKHVGDCRDSGPVDDAAYGIYRFARLGRNCFSGFRDVHEALHELPEREAAVLQSIYFKDRTYRDTAKVLGITQHYVELYHRTGLERLRAELN